MQRTDAARSVGTCLRPSRMRAVSCEEVPPRTVSRIKASKSHDRMIPAGRCGALRAGIHQHRCQPICYRVTLSGYGQLAARAVPWRGAQAGRRRT